MPVASVQTATWGFIGPVAAAYLLVCGGWLLLFTLRRTWWPIEPDVGTRRPWLDLALVLVAAAGVLGIGAAYSAGYLIPSVGGTWGYFTFALNNLLIFSPLALVLILRKQPLSTVFLSRRGLAIKLLAGAAGGLIAVCVYHGLRSEWGEIPRTLADAFAPRALGHFPAVFLEGVALAFVFVRLRWALGSVAAVLVPSLLFAIAHIPRQMSDGESPATIVVFVFVNTLLPATILLLIQRGRDVIWLGLVHYVMDVAIRAFD